jgi:hypothetical protein
MSSTAKASFIRQISTRLRPGSAEPLSQLRRPAEHPSRLVVTELLPKQREPRCEVRAINLAVSSLSRVAAAASGYLHSST